MTCASSSVDSKVDILIRWGCSKDLPESSQEHFTDARIINDQTPIRLATSKIRTYDRFDQNDVPHPVFWRRSELKAAMNTAGFSPNFPILGRRNTGSKDYSSMLLINDMDELRSHLSQPPPSGKTMVYNEYIDKDAEWRCHVVDGEVVYTSKRVPRIPIEDMEPPYNFAWGLGDNWNFIHEVEVDDVAKQHSINAVAALDLDFGAVDIIEKGGEYCVLEVNTSPGLLQPARKAYVPKLAEMLLA